MRSPVSHALPLILIAVAVASTGAQATAKDRPGPTPISGPAADYPVVVGTPFQVDGTTWTPEDRLNYDAVGYASVSAEGGAAISAAHKTLPLPSYAEVTSLDSGRTILVRVERRGPLRNDKLIELSAGAAAQLGLAGSANPAVRVRRVNPPEQERAMLRSGRRAPERMATPKGLLDALHRKLAITAPAIPAAASSAPKAVVAQAPAPAVRSPGTPRISAPKRPVAPARQPAPGAPEPKAPAAPSPSARGAFVVQVGAFSNQASARSVSGRVNGGVSVAGRLWRVRMGPFATRARAEAALAKARGAGYSDARIQRAD
jgi:rare lipoprotein A